MWISGLVPTTANCIATLNFYTYAKTGRMLRIPESNRDDTAPFDDQFYK